MTYKKEEKKETTSIKVNPELWKEFKIEALRQDMYVSELMERAIKRELERLRVR